MGLVAWRMLVAGLVAGCFPRCFQDAHGWCTGRKRRGCPKRREPSSYARVAWRFLVYFIYSVNYSPPKKVRLNNNHLCLKRNDMHLPGKTLKRTERLLGPPFFSRKTSSPKWFEGQRCQELLDQQLGFILGSQDVSTRAN